MGWPFGYADPAGGCGCALSAPTFPIGSCCPGLFESTLTVSWKYWSVFGAQIPITSGLTYNATLGQWEEPWQFHPDNNAGSAGSKSWIRAVFRGCVFAPQLAGNSSGLFMSEEDYFTPTSLSCSPLVIVYPGGTFALNAISAGGTVTP